MMQWISVKDRLPETDECVLVIASGRYKNIKLVDAYELANYYAGEGWYLEAYPEMEDPYITWWMPLPDPPTEQDHLRGVTKMMEDENETNDPYSPHPVKRNLFDCSRCDPRRRARQTRGV